MVLCKNYRANSQVVFNCKAQFWQSYLLKRHNLLFAEKIMDFGKCFDHFLKFLTVFQKLLNSLKIYTCKPEMKSLIERTGCDNYFCRSGDSLFFCTRNLMSLGKLIITNIFTHHFFLVEKQLRFGAKSFFEITFFVSRQYSTSWST